MQANSQPYRMDADPALPTAAQRRSAWMRTLLKWHWISSALCLVGMLFFATTGITLNNAGFFESQTPVLTQHQGSLPTGLLQTINAMGNGQDKALPDAVQAWIGTAWHVRLSPKTSDWQNDEVYVDLKSPGVDAWLSIDRRTGAIQYESADHGWVAFFNDLHKGKNAGPVWSGFITLLGIGCLVFSITGLLILQVHAQGRWSVWPVTGLGLIVPLLLILLFIH